MLKNVDSSQEFIKYIHKIKHESQPQLFNKVNPELYESIVNSKITSQEDV